MKRTLFFVPMLICACSTMGQQNQLPTIRPVDLAISYNFDGGMRYYSENLNINKDSCSFYKNDGGKKTVKRFKLTSMEMDVLYDKFVSNHFDKIESREESGVQDRGGISIDIIWNKNKNSIRLSDAQDSFIKENNRKDWSAICNYLLALIENKAKEKQVN